MTKHESKLGQEASYHPQQFAMFPPRSQGSTVSSGVQSLDRAVAILNNFTFGCGGLGVSEIARHTSLSPSTVHRLLNSLQTHGFVKQLPNRRYALGEQLLRLASGGNWDDLKRKALAIMRSLRDSSNETVGLHVCLPNYRRAVIAQAESAQPLRRIYTELEEPIPIHQGSPSKVLLAYLPQAAREHVLAHPLEAATSGTITDPETLRQDLARIRREGVSFSYGERVYNIHTVAAPIFDYTGSVVASLSVTGPAVRLDQSKLETLATLAKKACHDLSQLLGHPAPVE
jgi:IclR family acetate operon transcriptional repressor